MEFWVGLGSTRANPGKAGLNRRGPGLHLYVRNLRSLRTNKRSAPLLRADAAPHVHEVTEKPEAELSSSEVLAAKGEAVAREDVRSFSCSPNFLSCGRRSDGAFTPFLEIVHRLAHALEYDLSARARLRQLDETNLRSLDSTVEEVELPAGGDGAEMAPALRLLVAWRESE